MSPAFAYYFAGQVWQDKGTTYILLGEAHKTENPLNKVAIQQMQDVLNWAQRLKAHVVLEGGNLINKEYTADPFNYLNKQYLPSLPTLFSLNNESALVNFDSLCHLAGISINDVECRLALDSKNIKANVFYNHLMNMVKYIKSFNDADWANQIYKQELNKFEVLQKNMPQIFHLMQQEKTLSVDEFLNKYNTFTSEHYEPTDRIKIRQLNIQEVLTTEKFLIKDPIQKEFNILFRYLLTYTKNLQIPSELDNFDILSGLSARGLKISFEARLFDPIVLHAALNTNHHVKIICVGDAHRQWLSERFEELHFTKLAEDISPNQNQIDINQFLSARFSQESTLQVPSNTAQRVLAIGKILDKYGLIRNAAAPLLSGAIPALLAVGPSILAGYIAAKITPDTTIKIGNKEIPLRLIIFMGTYLTAVLGGTRVGFKYLIAPQPVKK